jgi:zinc protease
MKRFVLVILLACGAAAQMRVMSVPTHSPLVTFRIVFLAGSAADPVAKPGLAYLTATMLSDGSTKTQTYQQIEDALFPMAASFNSQVDKEMSTFVGSTHTDNLDAYYKLMRSMLLEPGWREEDFKRIKDDAINGIKSGLRNNDEELAKEVLYSEIFQGMPYGHYTMGTVSSLEAITLEDVKHFYATHYAQANLILGLSGGFSPEFLERVKKDFRELPVVANFQIRRKDPAMIEANRAVILDKDTRSVAMSIGFPISCERANPDYPALLIAISYLGQHRMSGGVLYDEMREKRGLNYGDYSYIEYFPRGMYQMEPSPNLARRHQIFQIWIRPVQPPTAKFALRLALYELDHLIKNGVPAEGFEMARAFVTKYTNVLTSTQSALLGYGIDAMFYGMQNYLQPPAGSLPHINQADEYLEVLKYKLSKVTLADVNRVVKRYLRSDRLVIVAVTKDGENLKQQLESEDPSPMTYNSAKPAAITDVDKMVEKWPLHLKPDDIKVVPVDQVFQ